MGLLLVASNRFGDHLTPPGHPERVERWRVFQSVASDWRQGGGALAEPRMATHDELAGAHDLEYIDGIASTNGRAVMLDPDTFTSPDSYEVARLAAGAALMGVEHALEGKGPALALVRPPGHHAERDRAMGFCLFNNVAVAAAAARNRGVERVAIMDFDVHHGNGTQWIFYDDPAVLYISTHQFPFYPGTGAAAETGHAEGEGRTVNIPLEAGATDADYAHVFEAIVEPVLEQFEPELLLVSAGFDAHARDPLAQMRVSTDGYRRMVGSLWRSAADACQGRLVAVTEGGYDLQALGECLDATVKVLAAPPPAREAPTGPGPRGTAAVSAVRAVQKPFWRQL